MVLFKLAVKSTETENRRVPQGSPEFLQKIEKNAKIQILRYLSELLLKKSCCCGRLTIQHDLLRLEIVLMK